MRLDKYLSDTCIISRTQAASAIRSGRVTVDGKTASRGDMKINEKTAVVALDGKALSYSEFIYILMNKPAGVVSATDDVREKTVLSLLPENYSTKGLFPAGRLDKDTVGLLVLTNDGKNAHRLLSPKHHVEKEYYVECDGDFEEKDVDICLEGVVLDGELTKPCILKIDNEKKNCAKMILTEGKYHEIKRICAHLGKKVTFLERIRFGALVLDEALDRGMWRHMTEKEVAMLAAKE